MACAPALWGRRPVIPRPGSTVRALAERQVGPPRRGPRWRTACPRRVCLRVRNPPGALWTRVTTALQVAALLGFRHSPNQGDGRPAAPSGQEQRLGVGWRVRASCRRGPRVRKGVDWSLSRHARGLLERSRGGNRAGAAMGVRGGVGGRGVGGARAPPVRQLWLTSPVALSHQTTSKTFGVSVVL